MTKDENFIAGRAIGYARGKIIGIDPLKTYEGGRVINFRMSIPGSTEPLEISAFNSYADQVTKLKAVKNTAVEVTGEPRRTEWPVDKSKSDSKTDSKIKINLDSDGHSFALSTADENINEVEIEGRVAWLGELEKIGETADKIRAFVAVPKVSPGGKNISPTQAVEIINPGDHSLAVNGRVSLKGHINNSSWGGDKKRYAGVITVDKKHHDSHSFIASE